MEQTGSSTQGNDIPEITCEITINIIESTAALAFMTSHNFNARSEQCKCNWQL